LVQANTIPKSKPLNQGEFHGLSQKPKEFSQSKKKAKVLVQAVIKSKLCSHYILLSLPQDLPAKLSEPWIKGKAMFRETKDHNKKSNSLGLLKTLPRVVCFQKRLHLQQMLETATQMMTQWSTLRRPHPGQVHIKSTLQTQSHQRSFTRIVKKLHSAFRQRDLLKRLNSQPILVLDNTIKKSSQENSRPRR
jgi:hypothetical protein